MHSHSFRYLMNCRFHSILPCQPEVAVCIDQRKEEKVWTTMMFFERDPESLVEPLKQGVQKCHCDGTCKSTRKIAEEVNMNLFN